MKTFAAYAKIRKITDFERLIDSKHGMTPLQWASSLGRLDFIRYLIMHGANVNATTKTNGFTPLQLAAFNNKTEAAKCLVLEGNCHINTLTRSGYTAIHLARIRKNRELENFLTRNSQAKVTRFATQYPKNLMAHLH